MPSSFWTPSIYSGDNHIVLFYRNFLAQKGGAYKHIGLGVSATHTVKVLRRHGYAADVVGVWIADHIRKHLTENDYVTHALIEAPFIGHEEMLQLCNEFPRVQFVCRVHSQIGFLQVEAGAVKLIREYLRLQDTSLNFRLSGNSTRFCDFIEATYRSRCLHLPNLYDDDMPPVGHIRRSNPDPLRVASFGSVRILKLHSTAAAAAMLLARKRNVDLEFYINVDREEHGQGVVQALKNMFEGLSWCTIKTVPWTNWADFQQVVSTMDLGMQVSATETHNLVSSDFCRAGIGICGSHAIDWLPWWFKADIDDAAQIARVSNRMLMNPLTPCAARRAIHKYVDRSLKVWKRYLDD